MADDMRFLANPFLSGLRRALPVPLAQSFGAPERTAPPPRWIGPTAGVDGVRPLTPADARMFLGQAYDPASTYGRNRLTGKVERIDSPMPDAVGQTTDAHRDPARSDNVPTERRDYPVTLPNGSSITVNATSREEAEEAVMHFLQRDRARGGAATSRAGRKE